MKRALILIFSLLLTYTGEVVARERGVNNAKRDTTINMKRVTPSRNIFRFSSISDKIHLDTTRLAHVRQNPNRNPNHISNLIVRQLFSTPNLPDTTLSKVHKFSGYSGRRIDSIIVIPKNSFKDNYKGKESGFFDRFANGLTTRSKTSSITRNLLFEVGDTVVVEDIIKSEAFLRDTRALSTADIVLDTLENGDVVVTVETDDSWNIYPTLIYRYTNNGVLHLSDVNFLGSGNRLDINHYYNARTEDWFKGLEVAYTIPNLFGKFINLQVGAGYGGEKFHSLFIKGDKYFVKPNDWAGGIEVSRRNEETFIGVENIYFPIDKFTARIWAGHSINISRKWGDNIYYTAKAEERRYYHRPYQSPTYSPYFHNYKDYLISFGFYKEKFYRGNMVYSYGVTESVPYGYNTEIILGYRDGEYDNSPYIGTNLSIGNMISIGYIAATIRGGMYLDKRASLQNTLLDVNLLYFTNLHSNRRGGAFRHFVNANYTSLYETLHGAYTVFQFASPSQLTKASMGAIGTTRLNIKNESVFFTPYHIGGFRFALFGYGDVGTIGYNRNPIKNDFYAIVGAGVRVRNEALVFKTIEFKVMFALKGHEGFRNNLFYMDSNSSLQAPRFIPKEPQIIEIY